MDSNKFNLSLVEFRKNYYQTRWGRNHRKDQIEFDNEGWITSFSTIECVASPAEFLDFLLEVCPLLIQWTNENTLFKLIVYDEGLDYYFSPTCKINPYKLKLGYYELE